MKRPVLIWAIFMILGIIYISITNNLIMFLLAIIIGVLISYALKMLGTIRFIYSISCIIFFFIGAMEYHFLNQKYLHTFDEFVGAPSVIRAVVETEAELTKMTAVYIVNTSQIKMDEKIYNVSGSLSSEPF